MYIQTLKKNQYNYIIPNHTSIFSFDKLYCSLLNKQKMEIVDIPPAINISYSDVNNQLSSQEFQTTLYHWFNQKGIVSNMRSFLRMKMINALKSTTIGETLKINNNVNLDDQALNILIADYLFQHGYDYSLSVFSTEVPIKTLVSEFCFFLFNKEKNQYRHKIDEENVLSVIELLGINGNSELAREILKTYKQFEHGTLLLCILKVVMNYYKPENSSEGNVAEIGKFIKRIMIHFNLPSSVINHMIENINVIVKNHIKQIVGNISKYHEQETDILRTEYKNKEYEFKQKLKEVDEFLSEENKRIEKEHRKLIYLSENMISNEKKLAEKCKEMKEKLKKINEFETKLAENLRNNDKKGSDDGLQQIEKSCKQVHCSQQCEINLKELEKLKIDRKECEKIFANQNHVIANLTANNNSLYKQVHESMMKIENLNRQLEKQKMLLEIERRKGQQLSEKTISSSEAMTVGTDGEGDHNVEDAIKESHFKLKQLEMESNKIEQKFQRFRLNFHKDR